MKKRNRIMALIVSGAMLFGALGSVGSVFAKDADENSKLISARDDIPLHLLYDEEAPYGNENDPDRTSGDPQNVNDGWERWSIPLGNGYFGVNAFGRTDTERIQITEKTLANDYSNGGMNNFSETYIDFGHKHANVKNYSRSLDLRTALSSVSYEYNGVTYTREYFVSYPDHALIMRFTASEAGKLNMTLRPTVPFKQLKSPKSDNNNASKDGTVTASVENGVGKLVLKGHMGFYNIDFYADYRVITDGTGSVTCSNNPNAKDIYGNTVTDEGSVTVTGGKDVTVIVTLGTNYELKSSVFTTQNNQNKIPSTNTPASEKVTGYMTRILDRISGMDYTAAHENVKKVHTDDYTNLFGRVNLDLGVDESDFTRTTDELLARYKRGEGGRYLESLYFQYGRYLLIASSRENSLPANLQGAWNQYNLSPWGAGYWHNINVEMNYWPAFSTNLAETFEAYVKYSEAYAEAAKNNANSIISKDPDYNKHNGEDGGNGWYFSNGFPYLIGSHSLESVTPGNLGFMSEVFWDYYQFTGDTDILRNVTYPFLSTSAKFLTKVMILDENGNYLVKNTDSPEQYKDGKWYYTTGTAYAQSLAYTNNYHTLLAAAILGISENDETILKTIKEQIDKYDPINVGYSGQVKEFREENYYGDIGEYKHRHISQLVGLYPGNLINGTTPAWLDAAAYTLTERGDNATGWGVAHRLNLWARVQNGERAYDLFKNLLKENTATNLWDIHPPFQVDGNLGGTAGVSEMLLQSHAGYIEPLAAVPYAWSDGSYTGLVARGNFTVAAEWANGAAKTFNITSGKGGACRVYYNGISGANVRTSSGRKVNFTVESGNLISFETTAGETYIISNLTERGYAAPVTGVKVDASTLGTYTVSWNASADSVRYNVYTAVGDAPVYTLEGTTYGTSLTFSAKEGEENTRTTFRVTAFNANGDESDGTLAYLNPRATTSEVEEADVALLGDGTTIQATVKAGDNAEKYRLYRKTADSAEYKLLAESGYPVILVRNGYIEGAKYAVSTVSRGFGIESKLYELDNVREGGASTPVTSDNVLDGKTFTPSSDSTPVHSSTMSYDKLTDGKIDKNSRLALRAGAGSRTEMTLDLGGLISLGTLRIYDWNGNETASRVTDAKIEAFVAGQWVTLVSGSALERDSNKMASATGTWASYYTDFDLGGAAATKIRITLENNNTGELATAGISIFEITCSGAALSLGGGESSENILSGKLFVPTDGSTPIHIPAMGYQTLTDGNFHPSTGRFALKSVSGNHTTMTVDLEAVWNLGTLRIYDWNEASESTSRVGDLKIEVAKNGTWTTLYSGVTIPHDAAHKMSRDGMTMYYADFDLGGVGADKLRLTMVNTAYQAGISLYEITCSATSSNEIPGSNALLGTPDSRVTVTTDKTVHSSTADVTKLFDGDTASVASRFGFVDNKEGAFTLEIALPSAMPLYTLSVYDFRNTNTDKVDGALATRSDKTTVSVLTGDTWITVARDMPLTVSDTHTDFNLMGITASAIRITFNHTIKFDGETAPIAAASLYEITCTAGPAATVVDKSDLLDVAARLDALRNAGIEDSELRFLADSQAESLRLTLSDYRASASAVAAAKQLAEQVIAAIEQGENPFAFVVKTGDSVTLYRHGTAAEDGTALRTVMTDMKSDMTVTLLRDITLSARVDIQNIPGKTLNLDLHGHTLTESSDTFYLIFINCAATVNLYSSLPGGQVIGTKGSNYLFRQAGGSTANLGAYNPNGGDSVAGDNLSTKDVILSLFWGANLTVDGGKYELTKHGKGLIYIGSSNTPVVKNATLGVTVSGASIFNRADSSKVSAKATLINCTAYTTNLGSGLSVSEKAADTGSYFGMTISGGAYYGFTLKNGIYATGDTLYEISGAPLFSSVDSGIAGVTVAKIAKRTYPGTSASVSVAATAEKSRLATVTWDYGDRKASETWLAGEIPENSYTGTAFGTYIHAFNVTSPLAAGADVTYTTVLSSSEKKASGVLTLSPGFGFALRVGDDGYITSVTLRGTDITLTAADGGYFTFDQTLAPHELMRSFTFDMTLSTGDTYSETISVADVAASALDGGADRALVLSYLDYLRHASVFFSVNGKYGEPDAAVAEKVEELLKGYETPAWTPADTVAPVKKNVTAASLDLAANPGFVFYMSDGFEGEVTVTLGERTKTYTVSHADGEETGTRIVFRVGDLAAMRGALTVRAGDTVTEYSLDAYIRAMSHGGETPAYLVALAAWCDAAGK